MRVEPYYDRPRCPLCDQGDLLAAYRAFGDVAETEALMERWFAVFLSGRPVRLTGGVVCIVKSLRRVMYPSYEFCVHVVWGGGEPAWEWDGGDGAPVAL